MKQLMRRLLRITCLSPNNLMRSATQIVRRGGKRRDGSVPVGHFPVYVGDEMERFVVNAKLLNHPIFIKLLNNSAQEYGYEQEGVLRIPCHVFVFERVLEAMKLGNNEMSRDLQDLLNAL